MMSNRIPETGQCKHKHYIFSASFLDEVRFIDVFVILVDDVCRLPCAVDLPTKSCPDKLIDNRRMYFKANSTLI